MRLISFVAGADAWLPAPKSSGKIPKDKKVGKDGVEIMLRFKSLMEDETKGRGGGRGRCLVALRELSHSSVELAQALWVDLFAVSWTSMPSDNCRRALIPSMEVRHSEERSNELLVAICSHCSLSVHFYRCTILTRNLIATHFACLRLYWLVLTIARA